MVVEACDNHESGTVKVKTRLFGNRAGTWIATIFVFAVCLSMSMQHALAAKFTEQNKRASAVLLDQGLSLLEQDNTEKAILAFQQAAVANPQNALAFSYLGQLSVKAEENAKAKKYFEIALSIDPDLVSALAGGGKADIRAEDLESAEKKLSRLSRLCGPACAEFKELDREVKTFKSKPAN